MIRKREVSSRVVVIFILLLPARWANAGGLDIRFTSGKSALAIPFELDGNHIILGVGVNGSPPLSFILDTGASHIILNMRHAKSFGMRLQLAGKTAINISGAEEQDYYLVEDTASFSLPGVVFSGQTLVAITLDKLQECADQLNDGGRGQNVTSGQRVEEGGRRVVDGLLGTGFFSSFVVEIDYDARLINLYDPRSYKYTGGGKSIPLKMSSDKDIFVRAQVTTPGRPPVTARLLVDSGSATVLWLTKQFAEEHRLLPPAEKLTAAPACTIGGDLKGGVWAGTLDALQLGGFKLSNPLTIFSQLSDAQDYDGFLGGLALRNFKVIFDYSRSRMILEPPGPVKSSR